MVDHVDSTSTASNLPRAPHEARFSPSLVRRFLELIRFSHTVFALPFAALACVFALVVPSEQLTLGFWQLLQRLLGVLLCMVTARSAAMAFNRLIDADIDARNPRTAARHIPAGLLSNSQVRNFFLASSTAFIAACLLFLPNWLPIAFSLPVLAWICGYSFAKRFTSAAHLWLGVALALTPICAWIALRGEVVAGDPADLLPALGLALAIALWVAGFDIIYACQDAEFDSEAGLWSIPARLGIAGALRISAGLHVGMLLVLFALPSLFSELSLGLLYYMALLAVGLLVVRQHALVNPQDLGRVGIAFFNINAAISLGFSLLAGIDACLR